MRYISQRCAAVTVLRRMPAWTLLAGCLTSACAQVPVVAGQVTASTSPREFAVNGRHVVGDAQTRFSTIDTKNQGHVSWDQPPYLGEPLQVYGIEDRQTRSILARRVVFAPAQVTSVGTAVVERILEPLSHGQVLLRADGYPILLTGQTMLAFTAPLQSIGDVSTNLWISYRGQQRDDGVIVAEKASFRRNTVSDREQRLKANPHFLVSSSPTAAPEDLKGSLAHLLKLKQEHVTPANDQAASDRVQHVLERLIPPYQSELPDADPTKLHFAAVVTEDRRLRDGVALPGGTILIPHEQVQRLVSDDELAAYLGAALASILEKQQWRSATERKALDAASLAILANPLALAALNTKDALTERLMEQRIRVALALMHDAGYDLRQAPKAWWRLSAGPSNTLDDGSIPAESIYAYAILGSTWRETLRQTSPGVEGQMAADGPHSR